MCAAYVVAWDRFLVRYFPPLCGEQFSLSVVQMVTVYEMDNERVQKVQGTYKTYTHAKFAASVDMILLSLLCCLELAVGAE